MYKSIPEWMKTNPIPAFFLLTFGVAWIIWLPIGYLAPDYFLLAIIPGAWAPTIVSVLLTWLTDGKGGVRQFLSRVIRWRVGVQWYLVVLFGIAFIAFAAQGLNIWLFDGEPVKLNLPTGIPENGLLLALPIIFFVNIFFGGPLAEDIGWRGYALPKLREKMSAFTASLLIGIVWVLWHLPFFWIPEGKIAVGGIPLLWFALLTTAWSFLFAWVYVNTESILMPVLFHAAVNTTLGTLGILGQANGSLTPVILNTLLTWLVVGAIVFFTGRDLKGK
ncbi:MAG: type II CAAX endopeptidase family protein [Anaerolineales bacterium]